MTKNNLNQLKMFKCLNDPSGTALARLSPQPPHNQAGSNKPQMHAVLAMADASSGVNVYIIYQSNPGP